MNAPGTEIRDVRTPGPLASALSRGAVFFGLWLLLTNAAAADLAPGLVTAIAASWTSLRLMPAEQGDLRLVSLVKFLSHFLCRSIVAGTEVALLALHPRLPLRGLYNLPASTPTGHEEEYVLRHYELDAGHTSLRFGGWQRTCDSLS
jgi:hypothetical protein